MFWLYNEESLCVDFLFILCLIYVTTSIGSDFSVLTKDSRLLKTFDFRDSKECLGFYSKILS